MARYLRTEGICLRRLDYSNTSQVASFLTPDRGQLSFLAKGVWRAPRRGVRCGFDLLGRYELVYTERRSGSLYNLTQRTLLEEFRGLRDSLGRILGGCYAAELALNFTAEDQACPEFYAQLLAALRRLARGENLPLSTLLLELAALAEYGSCPTFDACSECGRKLDLSAGPSARQRRLLFSPHHGGPLCVPCGRRIHQGPTTQAMPLAAGCLATLASLAAHPPARPGRVRIRAEQIEAASGALRFHMRYLLGKELRLWRYLQARRIGRAPQGLRRDVHDEA